MLNNNKKYRNFVKNFSGEYPLFLLILLLYKIKYNENKKMIIPCPISPNITPNKKGKNTILKIAGFISLLDKKIELMEKKYKLFKYYKNKTIIYVSHKNKKNYFKRTFYV